MEAYHVSEEDKRSIRETFNLTEEDVKTKVKNLKEWVKNSSDLPPDAQDEEYLNVMLLRGKFKEEYAKKNIESYFKYINKYPEVFARLGKFKPSQEVGVALASPKLTPKWERVSILKLVPENMTTKKFNINQMILVMSTVGIIMYNKDYTPCSRFILDFTGFTMLDLFRVNLRDLFKIVSITDKVLRVRISGFEILNAPRLVTALLTIGRLLLKPKMFSRISTHADISSVYDNIPKECLPRDYGGEMESTQKLVEMWDQIIDTERPFFEKLANSSRNNT